MIRTPLTSLSRCAHLVLGARPGLRGFLLRYVVFLAVALVCVHLLGLLDARILGGS